MIFCRNSKLLAFDPFYTQCMKSAHSFLCPIFIYLFIYLKLWNSMFCLWNAVDCWWPTVWEYVHIILTFESTWIMWANFIVKPKVLVFCWEQFGLYFEQNFENKNDRQMCYIYLWIKFWNLFAKLWQKFLNFFDFQNMKVILKRLKMTHLVIVVLWFHFPLSKCKWHIKLKYLNADLITMNNESNWGASKRYNYKKQKQFVTTTMIVYSIVYTKRDRKS